MREYTVSKRGWVSLLQADAIRKVSLISTFYAEAILPGAIVGVWVCVCVCIAQASLSFQVLSDPPAVATAGERSPLDISTAIS